MKKIVGAGQIEGVDGGDQPVEAAHPPLIEVEAQTGPQSVIVVAAFPVHEVAAAQQILEVGADGLQIALFQGTCSSSSRPSSLTLVVWNTR